MTLNVWLMHKVGLAYQYLLMTLNVWLMHKVGVAYIAKYTRQEYESCQVVVATCGPVPDLEFSLGKFKNVSSFNLKGKFLNS